MRDIVEAALRGHGAEYVEIRLEDSEATRIQYRGRQLEEINRTRSKGGCVRALVKGGWGFVSFNSLSGLRDQGADAAALTAPASLGFCPRGHG